MKKGFTLMEMLAVVMLVALFTTFALPIYRSIRFEMQHGRAEQAAVKMAEAMRSFYTRTKGAPVTGSFTPTTTDGSALMATAASACTDKLASGIPSNSAASAENVSQLFACGYLSYKDFQALPYTFTAHGRGDSEGNLVTATGLTKTGKYEGKVIKVSRKMIPETN